MFELLSREITVSLLQDYSSLVSSVATTVAHEMGHNFGMQHDNDKCVCPQDRCIMASISG